MQRPRGKILFARIGACASSRLQTLLSIVIITVVSFTALILLSSCSARQEPQAPSSQAPEPTQITKPAPQEEPPTTEEKDGAEAQSSEKDSPPTVSVNPGSDQSQKQQSQPAEPAKPVKVQKSTASPEMQQVANDSGRIALTFDAGASSKPTPALLDVLANKDIKSTFFLTGKWVEQNPELTKRIIAEGHEIGNHTYSHPDLTKVTDQQIVEQLERTEQLVKETTGTSTKPYFRPPYGARNRRVLEVAAGAGYKSVYWSADSWDAFKKGIEAAEINQRVQDRAKAGAIVLMHCGSWPTVDVLPTMIDQLRDKGLEPVKVSELE